MQAVWRQGKSGHCCSETRTHIFISSLLLFQRGEGKRLENRIYSLGYFHWSHEVSRLPFFLGALQQYVTSLTLKSTNPEGPLEDSKALQPAGGKHLRFKSLTFPLNCFWRTLNGGMSLVNISLCPVSDSTNQQDVRQCQHRLLQQDCREK